VRRSRPPFLLASWAVPDGLWVLIEPLVAEAAAAFPLAGPKRDGDCEALGGSCSCYTPESPGGICRSSLASGRGRRVGVGWMTARALLLAQTNRPRLRCERRGFEGLEVACGTPALATTGAANRRGAAGHQSRTRADTLPDRLDVAMKRASVSPRPRTKGIFAGLGIQTYGFLPMHLPPELNFRKLIHAADERIPANALDFGSDAIFKVLPRFHETS
jgi:hypothetical protein